MRSDSAGASGESKRHSSTLVACSEKSAKLTPFSFTVAPSGDGRPGQARGLCIGSAPLFDELLHDPKTVGLERAHPDMRHKPNASILIPAVEELDTITRSAVMKGRAAILR